MVFQEILKKKKKKKKEKKKKKGWDPKKRTWLTRVVSLPCSKMWRALRGPSVSSLTCRYGR